MHRLWSVLLAAILIALAACTDQSREPLHVASSPWPGYEPLFLARDLGYIDNSRVRLSELPSANITMEAFRNHSIDIASLTLDEALTLLSEGRKLRILLAMDISNGADAVLARPEIRSLPDLKGKRVAITNIPLGIYMLSRTLDAAGLQSTDVKVLPMPEDAHEESYRQGSIDAAITFEPFKSRLVKAGAHVIFDSSKIPSEIFDLLLVDEKVYNTRRDELCELVRQWYRTLDYAQTHPDDAATRMGHRLGVDAREFKNMMGGLMIPTQADNARLLGGKTPAILIPARRLAEVMQREHMLSGPVDISIAIDPDFQKCQ